MRWQELFADLEAQAHSLERADEEREIADRVRGELARVSLVNRLRANISRRVTVSIVGAADVRGELQRVGADWLLVASGDEVIIPLSAVMSLVDLAPAAVTDDGVGPVSSRLRLTSALRAVARDRSAVTVVLRDGKALVGTPDRVGADFVDVAMHHIDQAPRHRQVRSGRPSPSMRSPASAGIRPAGADGRPPEVRPTPGRSRRRLESHRRPVCRRSGCRPRRTDGP
ncbi:MAG: hypothetical protein H0V07_11170 [Propionibacteriales bacterium]|nr:hypothetical protein [Propionibacteriales bacterium]